MIEVYPGLFIGKQRDCPLHGGQHEGNWAVVHAYPLCHRTMLGYTSLFAPDGPEHYAARREQHLLLNMIDAEQPEYYSKERLIDPALAFIDEMRASGAPVLIHCEQGMSRSPSLALLYLATRLVALPTESLAAAEAQFEKRYPRYAPGYGIWSHVKHHWAAYCADGRQKRTSPDTC